MDSAEEWASRLPVTKTQQDMCIPTIRQTQTDTLRWIVTMLDPYAMKKTKTGDIARTMQRQALQKIMRIMKEPLD